MAYTLYKRLRRLLFGFKKDESRLLKKKRMHRVFIVLNRMHQFSKHSIIPLRIGNIYSTRPYLRNEDFISPDEEKRLKYIVNFIKKRTFRKQLPVRPLLTIAILLFLNPIIDYGFYPYRTLTALNNAYVPLKLIHYQSSNRRCKKEQFTIAKKTKTTI